MMVMVSRSSDDSGAIDYKIALNGGNHAMRTTRKGDMRCDKLDLHHSLGGDC